MRSRASIVWFARPTARSPGDIAFGHIVNGTLDLGAGPVISAGAADAAVARFDWDGTNGWLFRSAAPLVAHLASGELVAAGTFRSGLDCGTGRLAAAAQAIHVLHFAAE